MILDLFGYDRHGEVREIATTLQKNALNTLDVSLAAARVATVLLACELKVIVSPHVRVPTLSLFTPPHGWSVLGSVLDVLRRAAPADPRDLYQAWYIGVGVLLSSLLVVVFGKRAKPVDIMARQWISKIP
jgi:hypothetical protein